MTTRYVAHEVAPHLIDDVELVHSGSRLPPCVRGDVKPAGQGSALDVALFLLGRCSLADLAVVRDVLPRLEASLRGDDGESCSDVLAGIHAELVARGDATPLDPDATAELPQASVRREHAAAVEGECMGAPD